MEKNSCGYCSGEMLLTGTYDCDGKVSIENVQKRYFLEVEADHLAMSCEIKFCPMCGKDLKGEVQ